MSDFRAVSIREAGERVGLSDDTIRIAVNKLELPARRAGRVIRIKVSDLEEWFDSLPQVSA